MRIRLAAAVLLAGTALPAAAQPRETQEQRIERLEQQLRAVQRRVFPGGPQVQREIAPPEESATRPDGTGTSAVAVLAARLDAIEAQLATLTGQIEENGHRARQLEQALNSFRDDAAARLARLETPSAPAETAVAEPAAREPVRTAATSEPAATEPATPARAAAADPAEEAYNAGFRLWDARRYEEAQTALQAVAERYPRSRWASWANNLAGRAFLDDDKPATAARIFLANYQGNPQGERAADSLYFLGQALTQLNRRPEACRVYDELAQIYPNMRAWLRQRLPEARRTARCTTA